MSPFGKAEASPVDFQLRAAGISSHDSPNSRRSGKHSRGFLPHVKLEGASYFVTFRLDGTLPKETLLKLQQQRSEHMQALSALPEANYTELRGIQRTYFKALETALDTRDGSLADPRLAGLVSKALRFFDKQRYCLTAWVVMPTHVHAVLRPIVPHTLSEILHSWRRFTAREANKLLGRAHERFWQPESYDHWIRNDQEHARCCHYTINNPVKAGLCETPEQWPWSSAHCSAGL